MKALILRCDHCHRYTMEERCPSCGAATTTAHPARFSPDDKYARYRSPLAYESD